MTNIAWYLIFLSILNTFVRQSETSLFRGKIFSKAELKAIEDNTYFTKHQLSPEEKRKIIGFLKSITNVKPSSKKTKLVEDPAGYCQSFRTCFECTRSVWYPCTWCHNYGCTDKPEKLCSYATTKLDFGDSNPTDDLKALCPYIEHQGSILVPAGVRQNIQVKLHTSDPVLYEKELICQLQFSDRVTHLKALIMNDVVYCYPVTLHTTDQGETNIGSMRLIWGGVRPFSNKIPISVYRCDSLAFDCDSCRLITPEYACGWCNEENKCLIADKCSDLLMWNINRLTCKNLSKKMLYV